MFELQRPGFALAASLALLIFLVPALPASAQIADHQWEWGFSVGSANIDSSGEDFDLDFRVDFRGGYIFSDHFQLEAQLIQANAPLDASLGALMINGVFNLRSDQTVVPYFLVGGGYSKTDDINFLGSAPGVEDESAAFQLGFGSRLFVGAKRQMAVRLELSSLWLDTDAFDGDQHTSLTAGLSWIIGKR